MEPQELNADIEALSARIKAIEEIHKLRFSAYFARDSSDTLEDKAPEPLFLVVLLSDAFMEEHGHLWRQLINEEDLQFKIKFFSKPIDNSASVSLEAWLIRPGYFPREFPQHPLEKNDFVFAVENDAMRRALDSDDESAEDEDAGDQKRGCHKKMEAKLAFQPNETFASRSAADLAREQGADKWHSIGFRFNQRLDFIRQGFARLRSMEGKPLPTRQFGRAQALLPSLDLDPNRTVVLGSISDLDLWMPSLKK